MFNPSRLAAARKRRGLSQLGLAKQAKLSASAISAYEAGTKTPSDANLAALARALEFPIEFMAGPDIELPDIQGASFRALTYMTAAQRDGSLASGAIAMELSRWIEEKFDLPKTDIPTFPADPDTAASILREDWKLGERPIRNMIHLLESRGVRVFSLPIDSLAVDAFSVWHHGRPFVFLNTKKSGEHSRFDAAHELGHLVLHRHGGPTGRLAEIEANRFAAAFLMPAGSVLATAPRVPTIPTLIQLKKTWMVSLSALAHRLHSLKLLSDWYYRQICIQIVKLGYHRNEPQGLPRETSQVLTKVFSTLRAEGTTRGKIAQELRVPVTEVEAQVFRLVTFSVISGGGTGDRSRSRPAGTPLRRA